MIFAMCGVNLNWFECPFVPQRWGGRDRSRGGWSRGGWRSWGGGYSRKSSKIICRAEHFNGTEFFSAQCPDPLTTACRTQPELDIIKGRTWPDGSPVMVNKYFCEVGCFYNWMQICHFASFSSRNVNSWGFSH